tara:strand:+ start:760 stop:1926 length:1167 start_codon:yes stop_codon:yes gene_type:complete
MANGNKLYSAYKGAGKASSAYKASLYDVESLGIEREASQAMYQFETTKRDKNLALIQQGLSLASDLYGGYKAKEQAKTDRASLQESMAKESYEGEVSWSDLTDTARQSQIDKFSPIESKRTLGEILMGEQRSYTFGEGGKEFTSAQITAGASLLQESDLADLIGVGKKSKLEKAQESVLEKVEDVESSSESKILKSDEQTSVTVDEIFDPIINNKTEETLPENNIIPKYDTTKQNFDLLVKPEKKKNEFEFNFNMDFGSSMGAGSTGYKSFAKGGEYTTDGPELILVGDNPSGKEKVKVKPIKSKKKEKSEGQESLADGLGTNLKKLISKKGTKPGSKKWMSNYIQSQKINNESLRPLQGELSKHNKKLFSMAEESGYFGEFFRGGWE